MTFSHYLAHTEPIFNALHILPFHKLFLYSTGIFMYKYSINCLPSSLCKLYVKNSIVHQHNTRNCDTLRVSKGTKTFIRISALVWNTLLRTIVCNGSISNFKTTLKLYLFHNNLTLTYSKQRIGQIITLVYIYTNLYIFAINVYLFNKLF